GGSSCDLHGPLEVGVDLVHAAVRANALEGRPALLVEGHERSRLLAVHVEPAQDRLRLVVRALYERRATAVAVALHLGRVEVDVVDRAALRAAPPTAEALHDRLIGGLEEHDEIDAKTRLLEDLVEALR